ncbi:hypothetical protein O181_002056 [Austropuccinia psidii MF-1]|uniref:Calcium-channel protein CCH1 n=1 Tax=Austropuccinia psidii MF-1 TaxID=1389203 RepID=A0A9Q3GCZ2_9BASI|nr:hypothetical protein [Austropuccinia psidii MF-1]
MSNSNSNSNLNHSFASQNLQRISSVKNQNQVSSIDSENLSISFDNQINSVVKLSSSFKAKFKLKSKSNHSSIASSSSSSSSSSNHFKSKNRLIESNQNQDLIDSNSTDSLINQDSFSSIKKNISKNSSSQGMIIDSNQIVSDSLSINSHPLSNQHFNLNSNQNPHQIPSESLDSSYLNHKHQLKNKNKTRSFHENDELNFTSLTLAQNLNTAITPAWPHASPSQFNSNSSSSQSHQNHSRLSRNVTLSHAAKLLRGVSQRVVNISGLGHNQSINLDPSNSSSSIHHDQIELQTSNQSNHLNLSQSHHASSPNQSNLNLNHSNPSPQLRGHTLRFFGPHHPIRLALFRLFHSGFIDPLIFILIIIDAIILTIQSSKSVYEFPRPVKGYFHTWEDLTLFGLFCVFTLEVIARIITCGFIFNHYSNPNLLKPSRFSKALPQSIRNWISTKRPSLIHHQDQNNPDWYSSHRDIYQPDPLFSKSPVIPISFNPSYFDSLKSNSKTLTSDPPPHHLKKSVNLAPIQPSLTYTSTPIGPLPPYSAPLPHANSFPSSTPSRKPLFLQEAALFRSGLQRQQNQLINQIAYLRQSWNRIDFVAVISFWISFILSINGTEAASQVYVFRALSVLRLMRLLTITSGTTRILHSLKRAFPLLVNVIFFILFAIILFSIVGVQSFKGSYERYCVWIDPAGQSNYTFSTQSCGGQYHPITGAAEGFLRNSTGRLFGTPKGYLCPQGQICMETGNPNNGTQSFDNVAQAAMQVIVIASANTWSNMMFSLMDAEYFACCAFFIIGLLVLNFWLLNILVAVITHTFAEIMDETKHSAFATSSIPLLTGAGPFNTSKLIGRRIKMLKTGWLKKINEKLYYPWVLVVLLQFSFQASRSATQSSWMHRLDTIESYFTLVFAVEILIRLAGHFPDQFSEFFQTGANQADTGLAIITSIIQLPPIKHSPFYPWFTFFQIARFYRVIVAFPRTGNLLQGLRGSVKGLVNMFLFLLGIIFFAAILACQLLRGLIPSSDETEMTFYTMWNSFLAMYQVFSSENWTSVLYSAMAAQASSNQAFISGILIAGWFLLSNLVLLQMFIAVISEGFAVAEEQKRNEQIRAMVNRSNPQSDLPKWFIKLNPYHRCQKSDKPITLDGDDLPSQGVLRARKSVIKDFLRPNRTVKHTSEDNLKEAPTSPFDRNSFIGRARMAFLLDSTDGVLSDQKSIDAGITTQQRAEAEVERQREFLSMTPSQRQQFYLVLNNEKVAREAEFIKAHPTYDKVFWVISQQNCLRQMCQFLVEPAHGKRIFGRPANKSGVFGFQFMVFATIIGSIVVAAIATPVYKQHYFLENGDSNTTWFNLTEIGLGMFFILEFFIKVLADGFIFTPNAYLLNTWNRIDLLVLITLVSDVLSSLIYGGSTSRFTRSLKAFRALRMINLTSSMRETFYNVLIIGFWDLLDASVLTVMYIIPFAVWGQNLFAGLMFGCNDTTASGKFECIGEYFNSPSALSESPSSFNFLMPRAWMNPYVYSFDTFREAVLILFEIISQEGWINVMTSLMSIKGLDLQPSQDSSSWNAIYSLIYNLFGATIVLTLFLAVIINNFLKRSGSAFLTIEQQQWINLKRLIIRQKPSKRPKARPQDTIRDWCYKRATQKHGWWSRTMTVIYVIHVMILMTSTRQSSQPEIEIVRDWGFLFLATIYLLDIVIALLGLGWISFQQNGWRIFDVIVVAGTFGTTVPIVLFPSRATNITIQFQKFFLVAIAIKLVMKNNELNKLFKTAISSLPSIANLLGLWIIFFFVWGILFVENFSLTRLGPSSLTRYSNYQSLANALVMLAIQSTGEGWNAFMHDYTVQAPYCISSPNFLFNDCGSTTAAYLLFISWNVISMYIVLNMFTGLVVDNFAYVFQLFGKVKAIDREEVRRFKEAWAEVDLDRTGYIKRHQFIAFFSRLKGVFDLSVYPAEMRVENLLSSCAVNTSYPMVNGLKECSKNQSRLVPLGKGRSGALNVDKLQRKLNEVNWKEIVQRIDLLNHLFQEAILIEKPGKGLSFTRMMLLLAHYRLIEDEQAMQLEELLDRRASKEKVKELVQFEKIQGLLMMVVQRRRFKSWLKNKKKI